jgi:hypothetical protein
MADLQIQAPQGDITLEYRTNGGLFNQNIGHFHALMLAVTLGVRRFLWVPSNDRSSYSRIGVQTAWQRIAASKLYDTNWIRRYFRGVIRISSSISEHDRQLCR